MNKENNIKNIDKSKFRFVQLDSRISDEKFDTKPVGYLKDAFIRFRKNKSSVAAAIIIFLLIAYAVAAPILSVYSLGDKDTTYQNMLPVNSAFEGTGFWDGSAVADYNDKNYQYLRAIAIETGLNPVQKEIRSYDVVQQIGKKQKITKYYDLRVNSYLEIGVVDSINLSVSEYKAIQQYQDETGRQILYPVVNKKLLGDFVPTQGSGNYWYMVDAKGAPILDENGNYQNIYRTTDRPGEVDEYTSSRIPSDPGNYVYGSSNQTGYGVRICYYEYYIYMNGHAPNYYLGTNTYGQDMFCAIGMGARFSLILAVFVSAINLTLGTIYGACEGYYGGAADMIMERISDVLSGVPFMIVVTLFQLYLRNTLGVVPSFLLAFVVTGWIGMASLVRKQFYRFKGQEYILAARTLGASDGRLMFKHIFPNSLGTIITSCVLVIPGVIRSETMLVYLGIVNLTGSTTTSLGTLMEQGQACMTQTPHVLFFPALFFSLLMISFNLFGNGLRDAFNPTLRGEDK